VPGPPRSPRAERMAQLELELASAEAAQNYSGARRLSPRYGSALWLAGSTASSG
jgi:hypothetical protein